MADANNKDTIEVPEVLPLIPLRDLIIFPNLVVPLFVGRDRSIKALEDAMRTDHVVALVAQKEAETQEPEIDDLYEIGSAATVFWATLGPDMADTARRAQIIPLS